MAALPPSPFEFGVEPFAPDEAVVASDAPEVAAADFLDIDCIGEIFAGARKMFDPDPTAYTNADEVLYDLLRLSDDPRAADLIEIPYGMEGIFDPPPLFLRQAS